ncbi:MAG: hypothetical protein WDN45_15110 [Caulobacteraceae bacterium]
MSAAEVLDGLLRANLAAGAAILGAVALRKMARARFGARLAYGLWLLPVLAGAAVLIPARRVVVVMAVGGPDHRRGRPRPTRPSITRVRSCASGGHERGSRRCARRIVAAGRGGGGP